MLLWTCSAHDVKPALHSVLQVGQAQTGLTHPYVLLAVQQAPVLISLERLMAGAGGRKERKRLPVSDATAMQYTSQVALPIFIRLHQDSCRS